MTRFEHIRRMIGLFLVRLQLRQERDTVVDFSDSITSARKVLLIMPSGGDYETHKLGSVIAVLGSRFSPERLTFLTTAHDGKLTRKFPRSKIFRLTPDDFTPFFLPRHNVIQRTIGGPVDVAVDLNLDFLLPSAYICKVSGARIRVGFTGRDSDAFYNLQVQHDPKATKQQLYDRMAACLNMF